MTSFKKPVRLGYLDLLSREPDPTGLAEWDGKMQAGMTEAQMREELLRSAEFAAANPGGSGPPIPPPSGGTHPEMLLKAVGRQFTLQDGTPVEFAGAIACCDTEEGEPDPEWPLASAAFRAHVAEFGVNFLHIRLGPWRTVPGGEDHLGHIGGAYPERSGKADLSGWNDVFWNHVDQLIRSAGDAGQWVEVDVIDGWGLKHKGDPGWSYKHPWVAGNNLQGKDWMSTAGSGPIQSMSEHAVWVRKVVNVCGRHGNVIFQLGNENGLIPGFDPRWEQSMVGLIRDEEQLRGYGRHLVGTQSERPSLVNDSTIDYSEWHTGGGSVTPGSKPTLVNEYNPEPPLTAGAAHTFYCNSQATGVGYWMWRHTMSRSDWNEALILNQSCVGGLCPRPNFDAPGWGTVSPKPGSRTVGQLSASEAAVTAAHPELFNGTCLDSNTQENRIRALTLIADHMTGAGVCAWQTSDAIMAIRPDGLWEELHAMAWGNGCLLSPSNAYKLCWRPPGHTTAMALEFDEVDGQPKLDVVEDIIVLPVIVQGRAITVQIPVQGTIVAPPPGHRIDERFYQFDIPPAYKVVGVRSFLGLDQTNYGEYALDVTSDQGRLYSRSMHKETPRAMYEAWERVILPAQWSGGRFYIHTLAHQTALAAEPKTGNVQFELVLEVTQ